MQPLTAPSPARWSMPRASRPRACGWRSATRTRGERVRPPAPAATTHYTVTSYDRSGRELDAHISPAASSGRACTRIWPAPGDRDGYTIVRLATTRPDFTGETFVHVARDPATGAPRVIGVWRR